MADFIEDTTARQQEIMRQLKTDSDALIHSMFDELRGQFRGQLQRMLLEDFKPFVTLLQKELAEVLQQSLFGESGTSGGPSRSQSFEDLLSGLDHARRNL